MPDKKSGYGISLSSENNMRADESEADIVCQRIKFLSDKRRSFQHTCQHTIKEIKIALNMIKTSAHSYWASNAITLAIQPENKFRQVTVFGIWRVIAFAMDVLL